MAEEKEEQFEVESIQAEQVNAMYYDAGLIEPHYTLRRLNTIRGRIYFRFADEANLLEPIFYGGTTNMTSEIPKSEQLIDWYASKGAEWAKRNYYQRMLFGSLEHLMLADYAIFKKLNLVDKLHYQLPEQIPYLLFYIQKIPLIPYFFFKDFLLLKPLLGH